MIHYQLGSCWRIGNRLDGPNNVGTGISQTANEAPGAHGRSQVWPFGPGFEREPLQAMNFYAPQYRKTPAANLASVARLVLKTRARPRQDE